MVQAMLRVTIVGAGIAGTALAAALDPTRVAVTLVEQRAHPRELPTAFGIWPFARRILADLGLNEVVAGGVRVTGGTLYDGAGRPLARVRGSDLVMVPRPVLLGALAAAVPATVRRRTERVEDPASLSPDADLIVAADGARSLLRRRVWHSTPRTAGVWALRGVIADPAHAADGAAEYWSPAGLVGITPNLVPPAGPSTNWYVTLRARDLVGSGLPAPDVVAALAAARRTCADHPEPVRRLLTAADPQRTVLHEIVEARPVSRLVRGDKPRYVLVGDAAHAMSPHLGRGACEALADAAALAAVLNADGLAGLRRYERARLVRPQLARVASAGMRRLSASGPATYGLIRALARPA